MILVNVRNSSKNINHTPMLCNVRHIWPEDACFDFNTYHHWKVLAVWGSYNSVLVGWWVTQGDPLALILYGM